MERITRRGESNPYGATRNRPIYPVVPPALPDDGPPVIRKTVSAIASSPRVSCCYLRFIRTTLAGSACRDSGFVGTGFPALPFAVHVYADAIHDRAQHLRRRGRLVHRD